MLGNDSSIKKRKSMHRLLGVVGMLLLVSGVLKFIVPSIRGKVDPLLSVTLPIAGGFVALTLSVLLLKRSRG